MAGLTTLFRSTIGKKAAMAVSGIVLFGFVFVHMLGNLKLYQGPEKINAYAEWLREVGTPALPPSGILWIARLVLLGAVVVHMVAAWQVSQRSRAARGSRYAKNKTVQADYATRTMRWGGVIIALYIVYHLLHLTFGTAHPDFRHGDVYHNLVAGFQVWWVSAFYLLANLMLGFHLYHGLWSLFQSLGWNHPSFNAWRRTAASTFALVVTAGNLSFPIAVLTGIVA